MKKVLFGLFILLACFTSCEVETENGNKLKIPDETLLSSTKRENVNAPNIVIENRTGDILSLTYLFKNGTSFTESLDAVVSPHNIPNGSTVSILDVKTITISSASYGNKIFDITNYADMFLRYYNIAVESSYSEETKIGARTFYATYVDPALLSNILNALCGHVDGEDNTLFPIN